MPIPVHLQQNLERIPHQPGCYLMHDGADRVVYVGKAKQLRNRLLQYFNGQDPRAFVKKIDNVVRRIDWILTGSEKEALLLESTLIKRHRPRFNVMLKDMERSVLLRISKDHKFPRVDLARRRSDDQALYFGPYDSAGQLRRVLGVLQRYFRLRTCSDQEFSRRDRVCIEFEIGRCSGPCVGRESQVDYAQQVRAVAWYLRGRSKPLLAAMEKRMQQAAEALEFESAGRLRDDLGVIRNALQRQVVVQGRAVDLDVMLIERHGELAVGIVLPVRAGAVIGKHTSLWRGMELDDAAMLRGFLLAYYDAEGGAAELPPKIILAQMPDDQADLTQWLSERRGAKVELRLGKSGSAQGLLVMARQNAQDELQRVAAQRDERQRALQRLQRMFLLSEPPEVIDALDISTFQGRDTVGGKVRFVEAKKSTKGYRTVHIKGAAQGDDFSALRQVVQRLYGKHPEERPDLLMVDGGRAQVAAVMKAFKLCGVEAPAICGLAKARALRAGQGFDGDDLIEPKQSDTGLHSTERIFVPGRKNPLRLRDNDAGLALLVRMRDEVHRFAITAHRRLRQKRHSSSALDSIPGIGLEKRKALLRAFGSVKGVAQASLEALESVSGISPALARRIREALSVGAGER
jgi:excinuclease ABC subunit C